MERKKGYPFYVAQGAYDVGNGGNFLVIIRRHVGDTDFDLLALRIDKLQISQNLLIGLPCAFFVHLRICRFQVKEKDIGIIHYLFQGAVGHKAGGVDRGVDALLFQAFKELHAKVGLIQSLTARQSNAAAGVLIKGFILHHLGEDLVHRHFPAVKAESAVGASGQAIPAEGTLATDKFVLPLVHAIGGTDTSAAMLAFICHVGELFLKGDAFGVVAPNAFESATLEKDGSTDAVPIMNGEMLNGGDEGGINHSEHLPV